MQSVMNKKFYCHQVKIRQIKKTYRWGKSFSYIKPLGGNLVLYLLGYN